MTPRLLSRAWIFVSHSTKDIGKVRFIRNYLERAGAEPLIFRLKFLDARPRGIPILLRAEISERQFFLLCRSKHSMTSGWVLKEVAHVDKIKNKVKHVIDLDRAPWITPISDIETLLRKAFIVIGFSWADRRRVYGLIDRLKTTGVADRDYERITGLDDEDVDGHDYLAERSEDGEFQEPMTIDYGFRGLDDRPQKHGRTWVQAAISASKNANTIMICVTRSFFENIIHSDSADQLVIVRNAFENAYVLDPDSMLADHRLSALLRRAEWHVLSGSLKEQLQELVRELQNPSLKDARPLPQR